MRGVVFVPGDRQDLLWLDSDFSMDHASWKDLILAPAGARELPGGTFTSPPAGVSLAPSRLDVFGLGLDYSVYHKTYDAHAAFGHRWSASWENLGGNMTSPPVVLSAAANQIDLFCLGPDQGLLHRRWNGSAWSNWEELGGSFTSPPVVLPVLSGEYDIFARGLDFRIYHAKWKAPTLPAWAPLGGGLLGEPVAASTPAAVRVHDGAFVFVAGTDGAIWYTLSDGKVWKPWNSLGPARKGTAGTPATQFITEPVVAAFFPNSDISFGLHPGAGGISTGHPSPGGGTGTGPPPPGAVISGHVRIDVFAVGEDRVLWHKFLNDGAWHGETIGGIETGNWVPLPGSSLACAPSILWSNHGQTVIAMPLVNVQMAAPYVDGTIHLWNFDGTIWKDMYSGPGLRFRLPSTYTFSLDTVQISNTRALHNDTDLAISSLAVGTWAIRGTSFSMGSLNNGSYDYSDRLSIGPISVELCEPVIFTFSITNKDDSTTVSVAETVISIVQKGTEDYVNDQMKKANGGGDPTFVGSLEGAAFAAALDWVVSKVGGWFFQNCDGVVVADSKVFSRGRAIQELVATAGVSGKFTSTAQYIGTDAPNDCHISDYTASPSITQA